MFWGAYSNYSLQLHFRGSFSPQSDETTEPVLVKHKISVVPLMTERRNSEFDLTLVHSLEDLPFFEGVMSNINLRKSQENMLERLGLR